MCSVHRDDLLLMAVKPLMKIILVQIMKERLRRNPKRLDGKLRRAHRAPVPPQSTAHVLEWAPLDPTLSINTKLMPNIEHEDLAELPIQFDAIETHP